MSAANKECPQAPVCEGPSRMSKPELGGSGGSVELRNPSDEVEDFFEKQMFRSKAQLKRCLSLYAIKKQFQFKVKKSNKKLFLVTCLDNSCKWRLRAMRLQVTNLFEVTRYVNEHTCSLQYVTGDHRQATSRIIGELYRNDIETHPELYRPQYIVSELRKNFGIHVSYEKAWRGKEKALFSIRGSPEEAYSHLPAYLYMIEKNNPGSVTELVTDYDNKFKLMFMCLGACIEGWKHVAPVIAVDGTTLKSKYRGILFSAVCKDGWGHIFPLAIGIGDSENDIAWEWFLTKLKGVVGEREDLYIVSDRHNSIKRGMRKVFPTVEHGYCVQHVKASLKNKFRGVPLEDIFDCCARAYRLEGFNYYMSQLNLLHGGIQPYLEKDVGGYEKWARAYCRGLRYSILTTNIAESFNAALKNARELPVTSLLE